MSKSRYLYEDLQDLRIAYDRLGVALLEALKPAISALIWLLERPYVLIVILSFWCALVVTLMIMYQ
jgi:hypothetical protein